MACSRTYSLAPMPFTSSSSSDLLLSPSLASAFHGWKILGFRAMVRHDISELACYTRKREGRER